MPYRESRINGLLSLLFVLRISCGRVLSKPLHSRRTINRSILLLLLSHTFNLLGTFIPFLAIPHPFCSVMSRWFSSGLRNNAYALSGYPRPIFPVNPDFSRCVPEYGRELNKKDCKEAIRQMPVGREGSEVDYSVNFHAQDYNLPMSYVWRIPPTADANPETTGK